MRRRNNRPAARRQPTPPVTAPTQTRNPSQRVLRQNQGTVGPNGGYVVYHPENSDKAYELRSYPGKNGQVLYFFSLFDTPMKENQQAVATVPAGKKVIFQKGRYKIVNVIEQ